MAQKILLIEDDENSRFGIVRSLSQKGYAVSVASNPADAKGNVMARLFDAVILGINRADGKGAGFIELVRLYHPYLPIIVVTGSNEIEIAVAAVRCGADNVLAKPIDHAALCASLEDMLKDCSPEYPQGVGTRPKTMGLENFFGTGTAQGKFFDLAAEAAAGNTPVLITGETGTGKGLLARWIHQSSNRSTHPFKGVNCSGLRGDLLNAEIFGAAGTTCAPLNKPGLLKSVGDGTLFLDEIGDMDLTVQAGLLEVLQAGGPLPPGNRKLNDIGFRLICTSNKELAALAGTGSFLPELLSRISGTVLRIPPLRERLTEFPSMVRHLLDRRGTQELISDEAIRVLERYPWPGNLRELKNALEQGLIISQGARLYPEHFNWLRPPFHASQKQPLVSMSVQEQHISEMTQLASSAAAKLAKRHGYPRTIEYSGLTLTRGRNC